ncbi:hypothetical protein AB3K25_05305 [Leuconostoc sp. MS02]|uniref:Uncharacterized protein n=1 Tax=Leuconostoc aquikimchii TaxID=3236804 RepID=A0ABV3S4A8_9LACO
MTQIDDIVSDIQQLFKKQTNTIYAVRIINQIYSKKVNIFFEYYKLGQATHTQQIAQLDDSYRLKIPEIAKKIRHETKLTVHTNIT